MTRARSARPFSPSIATTPGKAAAGWRGGRGPRLAADLPLSLLDGANEGCRIVLVGRSEREARDELLPFRPRGLAHAACLDGVVGTLAEVLVGSALARRETPITRYSSGISPAQWRLKSPGSSLRLARSPVAPNSTITWFSGRGRLGSCHRLRDLRRQPEDAAAGSGCQKMALPATSRSAPAVRISVMFSAETPPSTCVNTVSDTRERALDAAKRVGHDACPDRPGWMLMQRATSAPAASTASAARSTSVSGLKLTEGEPEVARPRCRRLRVVSDLEVKCHAVAAG